MTIVEFFDNEIIDNAMGTILLRPERTVFLYSGKRDDVFITALNALLKNRKIDTELIMEHIDISCLESAAKKIEELVKKYPDCDFDIAGGSDVMLVAMGSAARSFNLPLHTVNAVKQSVQAVNSSRAYKVYKTHFTVEELILLHGGKTMNDSRVSATYTWERNPDEEADIERVWSICKRDPGAWNAAIGVMKGHHTDKRSVLTIMWSKLRQAGLVQRDGSGVRYKNELVKYLLSKQGTALEMYTYISAKSTDMFDDGQSGVIIDWKGRREVENEIDVLLTNGAVGYFISCKNGMVDSSELYKLSTVASRFGGRYAKKILVVSYFEPDRGFMERADELGIKVIKSVKHIKNMKDFAKRLTDA